MKPNKGDLHLVEYRNPHNGRRHRIWLFRKQLPPPDTSAVYHSLSTTNNGHAMLVQFTDANGEKHCHRYPMANVARSEVGPVEVEK